MSYDKITSIRLTEEDAKILDQLGIGTTEALKRFCHERRLMAEMMADRSVEAMKEKIEKMSEQRQKWINTAREVMNAKEFEKFLEKI